MIISEIELTPKKVLKVHLDNVNGVRFGHIRIWAKNNYSDNYEPSTKGFGFNLKCLDDLIDSLIALKAKVIESDNLSA